MTDRDQGLHLLNCFVRGQLNRRDLIARGIALGAGAAALGSAATVATAAAQGETPNGEVVWGLDSVVPNISPFGNPAAIQWQAKEFMYDSLLAWDADLNVIPALAESWDTPDDVTFVFTLRQGVKFHDGGEMTSTDVVYSLEQAIDPPEPGVKFPYFDNIASVEAVDDYTVQVNMTKTDPTLIGTLAWAHYTPIVPDGVLDRIESLSEGIGTGPFVLAEYSQDDEIVYDAFPDFWGEGAPGVQRLVLKMLPDEQQRVAALRSNEIDGANFSPDMASTLESDSITVLSGLVSVPAVIHFSTINDVPWRDARVRQAINKVVDRQEIVDKVYGGYAEFTGAIPPGYGPWPLTPEELADLYALDVEGAQALMAEAGYADGFSVVLQAIAGGAYVRIAEIVQQAVKQINIEVEIEPIEIGAFAQNVGKGEFEWASTGRGMRGDPSAFVVDFRNGTTNNANWFGDGWINEEIDALYDEGLATVDQDRRLEIYAEIQRLIATDVPNLYTVQYMKFQAINNRLQGMFVSYGNTNVGLRTVTVAEE